MGRTSGVVLGLVALAGPVVAQDVVVTGELRPRFETYDPHAQAERQAEFTTLRTRVGLGVVLPRSLAVFLQLQDARYFGEESGTLDADADRLDMHQAWLEVGDPDEGLLALRVGRQEAVYGEERLVGALDWGFGRAFDGARLRARPLDVLSVDAFGFRISDGDINTLDHGFYGLYVSAAVAGTIEAYALWDDLMGFGDRNDRYTHGLRWAWGRGPVSWRLEGARQSGHGPSFEWGGFLVAGQVTAALGDRASASLWYDIVSGDNEPTDNVVRVFDTLFATNHKFYGHLDLFTSLGGHTAGRGLKDLVLKGTFDVLEDLRASADLHAFRFHATNGLDDARIGEELDVGLRWAFAPGVTATLGGAYFVAGPGFSEVLLYADENLLWGYLMAAVSF